MYKDESNHTWFQMSSGATIYHWGRDPVVPAVEALWQLGKQAVVPIFKLVSPDQTGGSSETIIVQCRIDNRGELDYYKSGGVLHYVLRTLAA